MKSNLLVRMEELHESMQSFLTIVNEDRASAEDINESWALCEQHSTLLAELKELGPPEEPKLRQRMLTALERLAQLNAIINEAVERQQAELTRRLAELSRLTESLDTFRMPEPGGGRCDVEG